MCPHCRDRVVDCVDALLKKSTTKHALGVHLHERFHRWGGWPLPRRRDAHEGSHWTAGVHRKQSKDAWRQHQLPTPTTSIQTTCILPVRHTVGFPTDTRGEIATSKAGGGCCLDCCRRRCWVPRFASANASVWLLPLRYRGSTDGSVRWDTESTPADATNIWGVAAWWKRGRCHYRRCG